MSPLGIGGFSEVVASVADLDAWRPVADALGWEVCARGRMSHDRARFWGVAGGETLTLGNPGADRGTLHLVRFDALGPEIRPDAPSWDTGGLFDTNARVLDVDAVTADLTGLGWRPITPPTRFAFGPFTVREVLMRGPDGVVLALIERESPPLSGWPNLRVASRLFNSTQIVRDLDAALAFYTDVLGFETYLEHEGPSPPPGANVLGLDAETAQRVVRRVRIVHPEAENDGSVELIEFVDWPGADHSARAVAPHRGLLALRFPCADVAALAARLAESGHPPAVAPMEVGGALALAVRAPDGARLEFFEVGSRKGEPGSEGEGGSRKGERGSVSKWEVGRANAEVQTDSSRPP